MIIRFSPFFANFREAIVYANEDREEQVTTTSPIVLRFKDNQDGTVTDLKTGLMWTKNANPYGDTLLFHEALEYIEEMNKGIYPNYGFTNWRLPQLSELRSLIDYTNYTESGHDLPSGHPFQNVQSVNFSSWLVPHYLSTPNYPLISSIFCQIVRHNVNSCFGYVWPVRESE